MWLPWKSVKWVHQLSWWMKQIYEANLYFFQVTQLQTTFYKLFFSNAITKGNDLIRHLQSIIDALLLKKVVLNHQKMQMKLPRVCNPKPYLFAIYMQLSLGHNQSTFLATKLFKSIDITTSMLPTVSYHCLVYYL